MKEKSRIKINNEWLQSEFDKNLLEDFIRPYMKHPLGRMYLRRFAKKKTVQRAHDVGRMFYEIDKYFRPKFEDPEPLATYQSILDELLDDLYIAINKNKLFPKKLSILEAKVTRGFDFFNATSAPLFGENLISLQSGVFFLSHTLCRSLEILLIDAKSNTNTFGLLKRHLHKRYVKASVALLSKDHTRTFTSWRLWPSDLTLLNGVELFIVAHEYAHLVFYQYPYKDFKFSHFFNESHVDLIMSDEEIAADAFALLVVYNYYSEEIDMMGWYGPRFLFKNLSLYEAAGLMKQPVSHPPSVERYEYIKALQAELYDDRQHEIMDKKINEVWEQTRLSIDKKTRMIVERETMLRPHFEEAIAMVIADSKKQIQKRNLATGTRESQSSKKE